MPVYGIIDIDPKNPCSLSEFTRYILKIDDIIHDPNNEIIYTDLTRSGIFITKYLNQKFYRKATIYHVEDKPRYNPSNLKTKKCVTSDICIKEVTRNSDIVIKI